MFIHLIITLKTAQLEEFINSEESHTFMYELIHPTKSKTSQEDHNPHTVQMNETTIVMF